MSKKEHITNIGVLLLVALLIVGFLYTSPFSVADGLIQMFTNWHWVILRFLKRMKL